MNDLITEFILRDGDKSLKFLITRLKGFEQFNLILKIIKLVAKGSLNNSNQVEQIMHNLFQTGKEITEKDKQKSELNSFQLVLDAVKGALSELSDKDRDWIIDELLKNVKIDRGNSYVVPATRDEINSHVSSFQPIFKLLTHLVKVNLGFLSQGEE